MKIEKDDLKRIKKLFILYKEMDDIDAYHMLIMENIDLVKFTSLQYLDEGLTIDELLSAGNLGLINGIETFDYNNKEMEYLYSHILISIVKQIKHDINKTNVFSKISFNEPVEVYDEFDNMMNFEDLISNEDIGKEYHLHMKRI